MGKFADIEVTSTFDLGAIQRALNVSARRVFTEYETRTLDFYHAHWLGWKYEGRPPGAPRLVSWDAWSTKTITTAEGVVLQITNDARGWRSGDPYAAFVKRSGSNRREADVVTELWEDQVLPSMVRDLTTAILSSLSQPGPVHKVRPDVVSATETLTLEI
jgi:hypothetical protein